MQSESFNEIDTTTYLEKIAKIYVFKKSYFPITNNIPNFELKIQHND